MRFMKFLAGAGLAAMLAACGGGGGVTNPSNPVPPGGGTETAVPTVSLEIMNGAGSPATAISAVEIGVARALVKDAKGSPVKGVIVTFAESGAGLLTVSPASGTALTDANGNASVEIRAKSTASAGATMVTATAAITASVSATAQTPVAITSAPTTGVVDPQVLANALNFLDTNPSDRSIVLAGSGGNGRSESATLRFRVVDKNNSPVKGAVVSFNVVPANDVTLNIDTATSDADGVVVATVSSKTVATAVVIRASINGRPISSQSDQLLVTTGVATLAGFDLSASKFNLNAALTGDQSNINVRIVDVNGNPVADGVPVVFTTNFGAIGTSLQGGCRTQNGACTVPYIVQDPRPNDGERILIVASTQVGTGTSISKSVSLSATRPDALNLYSAATGGTVVDTFDMGAFCKQSFATFVGTANAFPAPANTEVVLKGLVSGLAATTLSGSPILDQLAAVPVRTRLQIEVTAPTGALEVPCVPAGANSRTVDLEVKFTANNISAARIARVTYPIQ